MSQHANGGPEISWPALKRTTVAVAAKAGGDAMQSSRRSITTPQVIAGAIEDSASGVAERRRDSLPGPASIVLIDDDWDALSRLREVIEQDPDLAVVAACRCAGGAMLAVERYRPAVLILDVGLPDRDGVELIRDIVAASDAKVIVFTAAAQKAEIISALTERRQGRCL
jgi:CheY-like chemotaxis protein